MVVGGDCLTRPTLEDKEALDPRQLQRRGPADDVGYLIIRKITPGRVEAYLHLDVTASTPSGSYTQTAKFHGNYKFIHSDEDAAEPSTGF